MKMIWSPKGGLQKGSTHTHGTLRVIPSGILNRLEKLTLHKPNFHSKKVDSFFPYHVNALREAGLAPPIFLTMG